MYRYHYHFKSKPFPSSLNDDYYWLGEKYIQLLADLKNGILSNHGLLSLTGDVGVGKTTIVNALSQLLEDRCIVAMVGHSTLDVLDFFNDVAVAFKMNKVFKSFEDFVFHLSQFLNNAYEQNKKASLIIDESHLLKPGVLEKILYLSKMERQKTKLLSVFFVGQSEFDDILSQAHRQFLATENIHSYKLYPLSQDETKEYILHHLSVAGSEWEIFDSNSILEIYLLSEGYPRLINNICDLALLLGYSQNKKTIDSEIIRRCEDYLSVPLWSKYKTEKRQKAKLKVVNGGIRETNKIPLQKILFIL